MKIEQLRSSQVRNVRTATPPCCVPTIRLVRFVTWLRMRSYMSVFLVPGAPNAHLPLLSCSAVSGSRRFCFRVVLLLPANFTWILFFETISRPYPPKLGVPCRPGIIVRWSCANKKYGKILDYTHSILFLKSSSHATCIEKTRWMFGEGILEQCFSLFRSIIAVALVPRKSPVVHREFFSKLLETAFTRHF